MALKLKAKGIQNVRPLLGGVEAWVAMGHALTAAGPRTSSLDARPPLAS